MNMEKEKAKQDNDLGFDRDIEHGSASKVRNLQPAFDYDPFRNIDEEGRRVGAGPTQETMENAHPELLEQKYGGRKQMYENRIEEREERDGGFADINEALMEYENMAEDEPQTAEGGSHC